MQNSHADLIGTLAIAGAAVLSGVAWSLVGSHLSVRTDIVGSTTFYDYDISAYLDHFYIAVLMLPALAALLFLGMTRWGPLRDRGPGPAWPPPRSPDDVPSPAAATLQNAVPESAPAEDLDRTRPVPRRPRLSLKQMAGIGARLALPAVVIAVEVEIGWSPRVQMLTFAKIGGGTVIAYVAAVLAVSALLDRRGHRIVAVTSAANAVVATAVLPMLLFLSASTAVFILSDSRVVHYPWLPIWLVVLATAAAVCAVVVGLRRSGWQGARQVERRVLIVVVAPVALFLLIAALQGAQGPFMAFDDADSMVGAQLLFGHGLWPWKDVLLLHGFLSDGIYGAIGMWVFGATRWGSNSGLTFLITPLTAISLYAFIAYFARRKWALLIGGTISIVFGFLPLNTYVSRYIFIPLVLILFDMVLRQGSWRRCWIFMSATVLTAIVTPEATILVLGVLLTLVGADLVHHRWGSPLQDGLRRTLRCAIAGTLLTALWVAFLLATGCLSGFVSYYASTVSGHELWGALAISFPIAGNLYASVWFALPIALFMLTVAMVVRKIHRRSAWRSTQWVMVASATFVPLFYQVVLDRFDPPHIQEATAPLIPLVVLWGFEFVVLIDRWLHHGVRWIADCLRRDRKHYPAWTRVVEWRATVPTTLVLIAAMLAVSSQSVAALENIPGNFHPSVPAEAPAELPLGYTWPGAIDTTGIEDLGAVVDRYAGTSGAVLDFANELGITYFLLDRVPGGPFYSMQTAQTAAAQQLEISDLRRSRPPVAIFNDTEFGFPDYDGIWSMERDYLVSQYLLDNYQPWLDVGGQLVMLRDDLVSTAPAPPRLQIPPLTTDLYFADEPSCDWGDVPDFLDPPVAAEIAAGVPATLSPSSLSGGEGWNTLTLALPAPLDSYQWLEFNAPSGFDRATIEVTDQTLGSAASHTIVFNTLPTVGTTVYLRVGSCIQWHGYAADGLHLLLQGGPSAMSVRALP